MKLNEAAALAESLMSDHGLMSNGWRFRFDNAKSRLGLCAYATKTISMSQHMVGAADVEQVRQTMLHEIAHALLSPKRADGTTIGHGREWKKLAAQIGYEGTRTAANPYRAAQPRPRAQRVDVIAIDGLTPTVTIGDTVRMSNGLTGTVVSRGSTRWGILTESGQQWRAPFGTLTKLADGDGTAPKPAADAGITIGSTVRLGNGKVGSVTKKGRTRWHVAVDGKTWAATFGSVTLVSTEQQITAASARVRAGDTALLNGAEVKVLTTSADNAIVRDATGALSHVPLTELSAA